MGAYKQLVVTNPTIEELADNRVPDRCLDEVVVELKDANGKAYTAKYYPNDYSGAYCSLASDEASAVEVWELAYRRGLDTKTIRPEEETKRRKEEVSLHDARPNPQIRDKAGVSQVRLANHIAGYTKLVESVTILSAVYRSIPETTYANTGFAPEKLDWTQ